MTNNKFDKLPQTYEQYIIPAVEEIRDKQTQLPAQYVKNLKDFQMKFNNKVFVYCSSCSGSNRNLTFELEIFLANCMGGRKNMIVYNTNSAREEAQKIKAESGFWEDSFLKYFSQEDRRKLADKINDKINFHKQGNSVDTFVCNKDLVRIDAEMLEDIADSIQEASNSMDRWLFEGRGGRGGFLE